MDVTLNFNSNGIRIYLARRRILVRGEEGRSLVLEIKTPLSGSVFDFWRPLSELAEIVLSYGKLNISLKDAADAISMLQSNQIHFNYCNKLSQYCHADEQYRLLQEGI